MIGFFYTIIRRAEKVIFLPLFFLGLQTYAQSCSYSFGEIEKKAYHALLDLKLETCETLLNESKKSDDSNILTDYLANTKEAVQLFVSEDPVFYKTYNEHFVDRIERIENCKQNSEWKKFILGELKFQHAAVKLKFKEELDAFYLMRSAFKILEENRKEYPDFVPTYKPLGTLHILFGSVPDKYLWISDLAGIKGDIKTGVDYLAKVEKNDVIFKDEASLITTICYNYILSGTDKRFTQMEGLLKNRPSSLLYRYLYATLLIKNSQGAKAWEVLNSLPQGEEYYDFPYIHFLKGELLLFKGSYKEARKEYQLYLKQFKGKNSIKDTWFKISLCHLFEGNEKEAKISLAEILKHGQEVYDSDKYAERMAQNGELPDKLLSRVRFYTDGGYYKEAQDLLNTVNASSYHRKRDKLEYYYRTGRLYHKTLKVEDAKTYYEKTIQMNGEDSYYFAPNAALQLGYIYEAEKNKTKAKEYFEKALKYKNHEYKNSIDNKAKAALNRL